jgi:hypothetical protein
MKTLQIDEKKAKGLYENASPEFQAMLEDTFGKKFFKSIQDRIKSYEDACLELGLDPEDLPEVDNCEPEDQASIIAFYKLTIIARALNEGWKPNWKDSSEYKWFPWFRVNRDAAGVGCSSTADAATYADAAVGSRLCCKSDELATYFGKQFENIWSEYLLF